MLCRRVRLFLLCHLSLFGVDFGEHGRACSQVRSLPCAWAHAYPLPRQHRSKRSLRLQAEHVRALLGGLRSLWLYRTHAR